MKFSSREFFFPFLFAFLCGFLSFAMSTFVFAQSSRPLRFVYAHDATSPQEEIFSRDLERYQRTIGKKVCEILEVSCVFFGKPTSEIPAALKAGEADVALSGIFPSEAAFFTFDFSLPYFISSGRFMVVKKSPLEAPNRENLAGRRVGVLASSPHKLWLERHFPYILIRAFQGKEEGFRALSTGLVDVFFGDGNDLQAWMKYAAVRTCCRFLGEGFFERGTLSKAYAIAGLRTENTSSLMEKINVALEKLKDTYVFEELNARIFSQKDEGE